MWPTLGASRGGGQTAQISRKGQECEQSAPREGQRDEGDTTQYGHVENAADGKTRSQIPGRNEPRVRQV